MRSKKCSPPPFTPNSLGSCVIAMVNAAPALKPSRIVSLMKLTSELSRSAHASTLMPATTSAVSAAMSAQRAGSPAAMPATVAPTSIEMADVGPDRELARRAEQRVEQAPGQVAVDAVLRRQPGERRVSERHRDGVGGKGDASDGVAGQPCALIGGEPLRRRKRRAPAGRRCRRGGHPGGLAAEPSGGVGDGENCL